MCKWCTDHHTRVSTATFFDEFQTYLSQAVQTTHSLMIAGNFKIHMDTDTEVSKLRMCDILSMYDLTQHVTVPTHVSGHTLDLIITRHNSELLFSCPTADWIVFDHMFVLYRVNLPMPTLETRSVSYRKLKQIDNSAFCNDLMDITNTLLNVTNINQLVRDYYTELRKQLDRHAPTKYKTISVRPMVPWFDDEFKSLKSQRRIFECSRM